MSGCTVRVADMTVGSTGTTYNHDKTCATDYLLVPALSIPAAIGACDNK